MRKGFDARAEARGISPAQLEADLAKAIPLGRLVPASHFCTVDSLVFRYRAKIG
jgi:hypothetical protein